MPHKSFLFSVLFLILNAQRIFAATFTVTSNLDDNSAGTLRWAINQANANGTAVTDYIYFNLPNVTLADRTIVLGAKLPDLTSNIIIDASTQPGVQFGLSDARVLLVAQFSTGTPQPIFNIYRLDKIGIYGLKIDNKITWTAMYPDNYAIYIDNSTNIEIGNAGRGNVITNWEHSIRVLNTSYASYSNNINIYSNFIGLEEDGITMSSSQSSEAIVIWNIQNLNIGGMDPALGNIIPGCRQRIYIRGTYNGAILIANNKIGTDYSGTIDLSRAYGESGHIWDNIYIESTDIYNSATRLNADIRIINNVSSGYCRSGVYLFGFDKKFVIQGNKFGTDITGTVKLTDGMDFGIRIDNSKGGLIGQETDADVVQKNIIAFAKRVSSAEIGLAGSGIAIINSSDVTISRNSIFCDQQKGIAIGRSVPEIPVAAIHKIINNVYQGTAPPNSKIEVFEDDNCPNCEGKTYITTLMADNDGKWSYNNNALQKLVFTATTSTGETSEFSAPLFVRTEQFKVKPATCGLNNASITGFKIVSGTYWRWVDENGTTVSTDTNLIQVAPGKYRLIVGIDNGGCEVNEELTLWKVDPQLSVTPSIQPGNCGKANGSISATYNYYDYKAEWLDAAGNTIGTGSFVDKIFPGSYRLKLTALQDNTCVQLFGPYTVNNNSGPSLNTGSLQITSATCNDPDGSITGISASNVSEPHFAQWINAADQPVGNSYDLLNVPPGQYRFKFKDQSSCDTIFSSAYTIVDYKPIAVTGSTSKNGFCNRPDGSITVNSFNTDPASYSFRWLNASSNQPAGTGTSINNLNAGNYQLFATDNKGCEKMIFSSEVKVLPPPTFDYAQVSITDDHCNLNEGAVTSIKVNGLAGPTIYTWLNQNNIIAGNSSGLQNIQAGTYSLKVTDGGTCIVQSIPFTVNNTDNALATPVYDDLTISRYSNATLTVKNLSAGTYTLYADATGLAQLQQNTTGNFTVTNIGADTSFYIQRSQGSCSSPVVKVSIKAVDESYFTIPNAFTPNGDGKNDRLHVRVMGYIELTSFRIYNRWGQSVFETKKLNDFWDGTWKGNPQPVGAFTWIAEGKDIKGNTIRDKGSFVLIR